MKKYISYFLIALGSMYGFSLPDDTIEQASTSFATVTAELSPTLQSHVDRLSQAQLDSLVLSLSPILAQTDPPPEWTPTEVVKWLLRTLGSLITTLILALLHKWFPNWFPSRKLRNYIKRPRDYTD